MSRRLYLAGPINACSDDQVTGWRERAKARIVDELGSWIDIVDPADRDFRGVEDENYETIVRGDKADIYSCDAILAYCWQPSYGTAMELLYAWQFDKRVFVVVPKGLPVSPWVKYHATDDDGTMRVYDSLDDAISAIVKEVP